MKIKNWLIGAASILRRRPVQTTLIDPMINVTLDLRTEAIALAKEISKTENGYQPFFGLPELGEGRRIVQLRRNCRLVIDHFASLQYKENINILDVGCNCGFVTLTLAENFPNIHGIDISPLHYNLCEILAKISKSRAKFLNADFFDLIERGEVNFNNVDCVLLFSVVHQFIQNYGFDYTQTMIAKLVRSVDVVFIELAVRLEYLPHGIVLPEDPLEHFALCQNAEITLMADYPRPLYRIKRLQTN